MLFLEGCATTRNGREGHTGSGALLLFLRPSGGLAEMSARGRIEVRAPGWGGRCQAEFTQVRNNISYFIYFHLLCIYFASIVHLFCIYFASFAMGVPLDKMQNICKIDAK